MHNQTVAVLHNQTVLRVDTVGTKSIWQVFGEPNSSSHGVRGAEQLSVSVWWFLNETTVESVLLDALQQLH